VIRVIATMLIDPARGVIKGQQFKHDRVIGEPIQWARVMSRIREVDELVIFDVTHNPPDLELLERIAAECWVPVAYGGGIHDVEAATRILKVAEKVVIQPKDQWLGMEIADRAGAQAVVMCLNHPQIYSSMVGLFGEVLVQSTQRDGMMTGYDLEGIAHVRAWFNGPLIASSGAGNPLDCVMAADAGADAVAAGAMYAFTDTTPNDVKRALHAAYYPVRLMEAV
jgi:cyclase